MSHKRGVAARTQETKEEHRAEKVKRSDMRVCIQERVAFLRLPAALAAWCPRRDIGKSRK